MKTLAAVLVVLTATAAHADRAPAPPVAAADHAATAIALYCHYLDRQPVGREAELAISRVVALRADRGEVVTRDNACAPIAPIRIDFVTPRPPRTLGPTPVRTPSRTHARRA